MVSLNQPVGVFDSGVGGISVLKKLMSAFPHERFVYYGDIKNAPFGTKTFEKVKNIACNATEFLIEKNVKAIVLGCNTVTTTSLSILREKYTLPLIGVAPPVEEAQRYLKGGKVLVMATPATLKTNYILSLKNKYPNTTLLLPCPGLMELVESREIDTPKLYRYLDLLFSPYKNEKIDAVVLGCTHYPFVKKAVCSYFSPEPVVMDSSFKAAEELKTVLEQFRLSASSTQQGSVEFYTSGSYHHILQMKSFLNL